MVLIPQRLKDNIRYFLVRYNEHPRTCAVLRNDSHRSIRDLGYQVISGPMVRELVSKYISLRVLVRTVSKILIWQPPITGHKVT
jgi:hypothetical protein